MTCHTIITSSTALLLHAGLADRSRNSPIDMAPRPLARGRRRRLDPEKVEKFQPRRVPVLSFRLRMLVSIIIAIPGIITSSRGPLPSLRNRGMAHGLNPNLRHVGSQSLSHRPRRRVSPSPFRPPSSLAAGSPVVPWIACASATELRRAASTYLRTNDTVLEIGAQLSDVSATICRAVGPAGGAVLVDVERRAKGGPRRGGRGTPRDLAKHSYYRAYRDVADALPGDHLGGEDAAADGGAAPRGRESSSGAFAFPWTDPASGEAVDYGDRATFVEVKRLDDWRGVLLSQPQPTSTSTSTTSRLRRRHPRAFDALVVDLGSMTGNDLPTKTLSLVQDFISHYNAIVRQQEEEEDREEREVEQRMPRRPPHPPVPRVILIKSSSLSNLARRLHHARRIILDDGDGGGRAIDPGAWERGGQPHLVASVGVDEYRRTIPKLIRGGDAVLEVGCHLGVTTAMLHDAAAAEDAATAAADGAERKGDGPPRPRGFAVGVDIGPRIVEAARRRHPRVPLFAVGDAWHTAGLLRLRCEVDESSSTAAIDGDVATEMTVDGMGYDVVYADVGGLSGPDGLLESLALLDALGRALEPRCVVVKSLCVRRLASCLTPFSEVWSRNGKRRKHYRHVEGEE